MKQNLLKRFFFISEMNAIQLIVNRAKTPNKLSQSDGPGYKKSFI